MENNNGGALATSTENDPTEKFVTLEVCQCNYCTDKFPCRLWNLSKKSSIVQSEIVDPKGTSATSQHIDLI